MQNYIEIILGLIQTYVCLQNYFEIIVRDANQKYRLMLEEQKSKVNWREKEKKYAGWNWPAEKRKKRNEWYSRETRCWREINHSEQQIRWYNINDKSQGLAGNCKGGTGKMAGIGWRNW